jgi:hypothetical protein
MFWNKPKLPKEKPITEDNFDETLIKHHKTLTLSKEKRSKLTRIMQEIEDARRTHNAH